MVPRLALIIAIAAAILASTPARAQDATLVQTLLGLDERTAVARISEHPDDTAAALDALRKRFDDSIRSDRTVPQQRRVQYDKAALDQGLRLARLYAKASRNQRPLRLFTARQQRIEGTTLLNDRKYAAAVKKLTEALAEAERLNDVWLQIITRTNLAYGYLELGRKKEALDECERANALAATFDLRSHALTVFNLATMYMHLGDFERALPLDRQAADLARQAGNRLWEGNALLTLGVAYQQLGKPADARAALLSARDVLLKTQDKLGIGRMYYSLALVQADLGDLNGATADMERALPIIRAVDIRHSHEIDEATAGRENPVEETALRLLAQWYGRIGNAEKAREYSAALDAYRAKRKPGEGHAHHPGV